MTKATSRPAMMAKIETCPPSSPSTTIPKAAAALAPEEIPMMSGLASGLRSMVWKVTPPRPKLAPHTTASTTRGSRSSPTVNDAPGTSRPRITPHTSAGV